MLSDGHRRPCLILVEDNLADVKLLQLVWQDLQFHADIKHFADGATALAFLLRCGQTPQNPRPDGVVLDLNLPKVRGDVLLHQLRQERPDLDSVPVVVLTTSDLPQDRQRMATLQVAGYLVKPHELDAWWTIGRTLQELFGHLRP